MNEFIRFGVKHGYWEEEVLQDELGIYHQKAIKKGNYINGKRHGFWETINHKTGCKIFDENYVNGIRHGESIQYDDYNLPLELITYVNGKVLGKYVEYIAGRPLYIGSFNGYGIRHGLEICVDEDNMIFESSNWENGERKGLTFYSDDFGEVFCREFLF